MPEAQQEVGWKETVLGLVVILAAIGVAVYIGYVLYGKFLKPAPVAISISAYFVDDSGVPVNDPNSPAYAKSHVKVQGSVNQGEKPVSSGTVRVSISTNNFLQSVSVPLKDGRFEVDDPAFRTIQPGDSVAITVDVSAPGLAETATLHLNSQAAVSRSPIIIISSVVTLLMLVVFCYAFTGRKTPWKNRTAIIFSYLIILLFLGLPIVAPVVLLQYFPDAVCNMVGAPAGLIKTNTAPPPKDETQWALNIGGHSFVPEPSATTMRQEGSLTPNPSPTPPGAATTVGSSTTSGALVASPKPSQPSNSGATTVTVTPDSAPKKLATSFTPGSCKTAADIPVVDVHGGLVIPLYVIVLSAIGGAINMTRKVPVFQREGEESDFIPGRPISSLGSSVMRRIGLAPPKPVAEAAAPPEPGLQPPQEVKPELSPEQKAEEIEAELQELVTSQIQRNCDTDRTLNAIRELVQSMQDVYTARKSGEPLLKFNSFADWMASHARVAALLRGSWRVELLNQYMYLISAPFLAIVTYYILDLLGLSKQGVIVVLSFSVGLISEKIVGWILGIATGYLTDPKKA